MLDFKENENIHLSLLTIDLTGATELWKDRPTDKVLELRNRYRCAVSSLMEDNEGAIRYVGDGIDGYFLSKEDAKTLNEKVISLGIHIYQTLRFDYSLPIKMASSCTEVLWRKEYEDFGRIDSPDIDYLGHIIKVCPSNLFLISENIYQGLSQRLKDEFAFFGTTTRDSVAVYVYPKVTKEGLNHGDFLPQEGDINRLKDGYLRFLEDGYGFLRYFYQRQKIVTLLMDEVFTPLMLQERGVFIGYVEDALSLADRDFIKEKNGKMFPIHREAFQIPKSFEDVFREKKYIAIIGDPGSGKSTLLKWLAFIYSKGRLTVSSKIKDLKDKDLNLLPIIAGIGELYELAKNKPILEALERYYEKRQLKGLKGLFEESLKKGKAIVLLDSLDEVPQNERINAKAMIEDFIRIYPDNRFIITSRIYGYSNILFPSGITPCFTILPLKNEQIECLVKNWFVGFEKHLIGKSDSLYCESEGLKNADKFLDTIREPHLLALSKNPLLLSLLCLFHRMGSSLPKYRVQVYNLIAETLIEIWDGVRSMSRVSKVFKGDFSYEASLILNPIGLWLKEDEKYSLSGLVPMKDLEDKIIELMKEKGIEEKEAKEQTREFLNELKDPGKTHILQEKGPGLWGFIHLTFQEFFSAMAIIGKDKEEEYLEKYAYSPNWREVIKLVFSVLGVMHPPRINRAEVLLNKLLSGFGRELEEDIFKKNILLAGEIAAELPQISNDMIKRITKEFTPLLYSEFILQREEANRILKAMKNMAIGYSTNKGLKDRFNKDMFDYKTLSAMKSLDMIEDEQIEPLLNSLKDKDSWVRMNAISVLGKLGIRNEKVIDAFVNSLKDEDSWVRMNAANALEKLGIKNERVIDALINDLKDEDSVVRQNAVIVLGKLGIKDNKVINSLIKVLADENSYVRANVACVLWGIMEIKDENVIKSLISALGDKNSWVRVDTAFALGSSGIEDKRVIDILLMALEDDFSEVRESSASALGRLGIKDERVIKNLISALGYKDYWVREDAASALSDLLSQDEAVVKIPKFQKAFKEEKHKEGYFHILWKLSDKLL